MRLIPLFAAMLTVAGCASQAPAPSTPPQVQDLNRAVTGPVDTSEPKPTSPLLPSAFFADGAPAFVAWRCTPAQDLVAALPEGELRLWSGQGFYRLDPAVVASGARYVKGDLSFWSKGNEAGVESASGQLECQRDVSRETITRETRPNSIFFAKGNEPGWMLMLDRQTSHLRLIADYGQQTLTLPYKIERLDNGQEAAVVLRSTQAGQPFQARLQAKACFDSMSGMPYPVQVTLQWQERTLRGCGQGVESL
ncbi:COG3650 family protein [Modicisalibacter luteus]|uniref:COG3650 family protein n=1 Tax=Modicisalibacter luteus TaxID=453962 RepID=A0ABV7LXN8_9GAMM|nr:MliC family protein [Halomonas lutea]GHB10630.1 hypothetical protein GCM10007159_36050 [Halomonas lutea]